MVHLHSYNPSPYCICPQQRVFYENAVPPPVLLDRGATVFQRIFLMELNTRSYARRTSQLTQSLYLTNTFRILVTLPLDFRQMDLLHSTSGKRLHGHCLFLITIFLLTSIFTLNTSSCLVLFLGPRNQRTPTPFFGRFFKNFFGWHMV